MHSNERRDCFHGGTYVSGCRQGPIILDAPRAAPCRRRRPMLNGNRSGLFGYFRQLSKTTRASPVEKPFECHSSLQRAPNSGAPKN